MNTEGHTPTRGSVLLRMTAVLALIGGLFAGAASVAGAAEACSSGDADYSGYDYGSSMTLTTDVAQATPGSVVTIEGAGFGPGGCELQLTIGSADGAAAAATVLGTVTVGADGTFSFPWTVPADQELGIITIAAVVDGIELASTTLEIVEATPVSPPGDSNNQGAAPIAAPAAGGHTGGASQGTLPRTGSNTLPLIIGGLVLLAMGAALLTWTNRRRMVTEV